MPGSGRIVAGKSGSQRPPRLPCRRETGPPVGIKDQVLGRSAPICCPTLSGRSVFAALRVASVAPFSTSHAARPTRTGAPFIEGSHVTPAFARPPFATHAQPTKQLKKPPQSTASDAGGTGAACSWRHCAYNRFNPPESGLKQDARGDERIDQDLRKCRIKKLRQSLGRFCNRPLVLKSIRSIQQ